MTDNELRENLEGLFAYDYGATGSGIHDEKLRQRCITELYVRADRLGSRVWFGKFIRETCLDDDLLNQGYGVGDMTEFVTWLAERMEAPATRFAS